MLKMHRVRIGSYPWALWFLAMAVHALALVIPNPSQAEGIRFVPQLSLTNLTAKKIAFNPADSNQVLLVNSSGRIDVLEITDLRAPLKMMEIEASARDAVFNPAGDRIVSAE